MPILEALRPGTQVKGIIPGQTVAVVEIQWQGTSAVELFYKRADGGQVTSTLLAR